MSLELTQIAVLVPLLAAVLVGALPRSEPGLARALGLIGALVELLVLGRLVWGYDPAGPAVQELSTWSWLPSHGVAWSLGVDGGALWWLVLIAAIFPLALMIGGRPRPGEPPLIVGMLGLQAAWVAVVLSRDLLSLAAAWEFATITTVILLGERGDGKRGIPGRVAAARRFAGPMLLGAAALLALAVMLGVAYAHANDGVWSWELDALSTVTLPASLQQLGFVLGLVVVACSLPLIPLQVPLAQVCTSGPTPVVAVALGVGMPMGVFVLARVLVPLLPLAIGQWADPLAALAVAGAVYAGLACWAEREPGRLLAHAALVHMSLAIVAALSGSAAAAHGLGPYLLAHGLGLTVLTAVFHSLRRDGVHDLAELAGWASVAPRGLFAALFGALVLFGAPGSAGFIGGLGIVAGVIQAGDPALQHPSAWVLLAGGAVGLGSLGVVRGLWLAGRGVPRPGAKARSNDLGLRETLVVGAALGLAVILGVVPGGLLARAEPATRAGAESYALRRCLAIEAREQLRPRRDAELVGVCLDPVARIRQFYGLASPEATSPEAVSPEAVSPEAASPEVVSPAAAEGTQP